MIMLASSVAVALIVAQGFAVWGFLRFVKSFGAYTASQQELTTALLTVHESNHLLHMTNLRLLDELRSHFVGKVVA